MVAEITDSKRQFEDKYHSSASKQMAVELSSARLDVTTCIVIVVLQQLHQ
jgi:hypothetical protein